MLYKNKKSRSFSQKKTLKKDRRIAGIALCIVLGVSAVLSYASANTSRTMTFENPRIITIPAPVVVTETPEVVPEKVVKKNPSRDAIDGLIKEAFPTEEVAHARRVVWCESRYNAGAHNYNPATGDDSVGLGQINLLGNLFPGRLIRAQHIGYDGEPTREALTEWLKVPENNLRYFASMLSTSGWHHWSCDKMVRDENWKYRAQMIAFLEG